MLSEDQWLGYIQIRSQGKPYYMPSLILDMAPQQIVSVAYDSADFRVNCMYTYERRGNNLSNTSRLTVTAIADVYPNQELYIDEGWYSSLTLAGSDEDRVALFDRFLEEIRSTTVPFLRLHAWRLAQPFKRYQRILATAYFTSRHLSPQIPPSGALQSLAAYQAWVDTIPSLPVPRV
jgi:hypothetical protein